jgi:hypothetical protein
MTAAMIMQAIPSRPAMLLPRMRVEELEALS